MTENNDGTGDQVALKKSSLDKDLGKIISVEAATRTLSQKLLAPGLAVLFLAFAGAFASSQIGANRARCSSSSRRYSAVTWR